MGWSGCGELDPWDIDRKKAKEIARMFLDKKETFRQEVTEEEKDQKKKEKNLGFDLKLGES